MNIISLTPLDLALTALLVVVLAGLNFKKIPVVLNLESKAEYMSGLSDSNPYSALIYANQKLPKGSKVLFYRETRTFYLDHAYVIGNPTKQAYIDYSKIENYQQLYTRLQEIKITHIFINSFFDTSIRHTLEQDKIMDELLNNKTELIYNQNGHEIYRLK